MDKSLLLFVGVLNVDLVFEVCFEYEVVDYGINVVGRIIVVYIF